MEEEILNTIKEEYKNKKELKKDIENKVARVEELKNSEVVKEYLNLLEFLDKTNYKNILNWTDDMMLDLVISKNIRNIEETNGIYVCLGTFMLANIHDVEHGPSNYRLARNNPRAQYRIYQDIERDNSIEIPIELCEEFENTYKIIFPNVYFTGKFYYDIRREFIRESIATNQEKACTKILKKEKTQSI